MINKYANQNRTFHRSSSSFSKVASIYDKQSISNRVTEEKPLTFSSLAPFESEAVLSVMQKEAEVLDSMEIEKEAAGISSPFEHFKTAKNYISSKLGLADDSAHDLASSVVGRAQDLHEQVGGDLEHVIGGIVDSMDKVDIQNRVGAVPMRTSSPNEVEEHVKVRLIEEMQLSSFQAESVTKSVMTQARNLTTKFRQSDLAHISNAIVDVLVNHQDTSVVYGLVASDRLVAEVESHLNNA